MKGASTMKMKYNKLSVGLLIVVSSFLFACNKESESIDINPPEVSAISPANNSFDVPLNSQISVVFNKSVNNVTSSNFYLSKLGTFGDIPCNLSYDDSTKTATLILRNGAKLDPDTIYIVTLGTDIKSRTGVTMNGYSWVFTTGVSVDTTAPAITSHIPDNNERFVPVGNNITAIFSEQLQVTTVVAANVTVTTDLGNPTATIPCNVSYNDIAKKITIDPISNLSDYTDYYVSLSSNIKDLSGNSLGGTTVWTFQTDDLNKPEIVNKTPGTNETNVAVNSKVVVEFSESLKTTTLNDTICYIQKTFDDEAKITSTYGYDDNEKQLTISPSSALESNKIYKVVLTGSLKDKADNPLDSVNWNFTTKNTPDVTPPAITVKNIVDDASDIDIDTSITVTFDEQVSGTNSTNCYLQRVDNSVLIDCNIVYTYSSKTLQMNPVNSLAEGVQYRICLTSGIKDSSGNSLVETSWAFTTKDETKPLITSRSPDTEGNVGVNSSVMVSFNESVVKVDAFSFILKDESGNPINASVTYNDSTKTAILDPVSDLNYSENYTVTLSPDTSHAVEDSFANKLNLVSWSFATGTQPDITPPTVSSNSPANNATGISLSPVISVTFSENISGLSSSNFTVQQGATPVSGLMQYDPINQIVSFQPNSALEYNKVYTVTVKGGVGTTIVDNANNKLAADYVFTFTTLQDSIAPVIIGRTPDNGATGVPANAATITVYFSENVTGVSSSSFTLTKSGGGLISSSVVYDSSSRKATLTPVTLETATYIVAMTSDIKDTATPSNQISPVTWTFSAVAPDVTPPTVIEASKTPAANATSVALTANIDLSFDESVSGVDGTSLKLKEGSNNISAVVTYNSVSHKATINPDANLKYNTIYTVSLSNAIHDAAGNALVPVSWNFTTGVDLVAPQVVSGSKYPANGATNVMVNSTVSLTFDEEIANYAGKIVLSPAVAGNISYSNKTLTFTPSSNMASDTLYTVTVSNLITDTATPTPNAFAGTSWQFTTMHLSDTTPPTITGRSPAIGATGVDRTGNITINFSERIKNYSSSTIYLQKSGITVPTSLSYNDSTFVVTLDPTEDLIGGTVYTVVVKGLATGIKDTSDNPLAADTSWTFTTVGDAAAPTISTRSPGISATGVSTKTAIAVTFSESVSGVSESTFTLSGVPFSVVYDSLTKTATLTPSYDLSSNTTYTVNLTAGIKDLSNNSLTATNWTFTTIASLPQVASSDPSNSATGVSVTKSSLAITFNTAMNTSKQWVELTEGASTPAGVILDNGTWSNGDKTITYNVTGQFKQNTTYNLKLYGWGGTFEDVSGNIIDKTVNLTTGYLSFTTGTDTTAASVINTYPANSATSVGRDIGIIVLRFNEPMNQTRSSTLTSTTTATRVGWVDGGRTVIFTVPQLNPSTSYTFTLGTGGGTFRDIAGNNSNTYSFSFTTGSSTGSTVILSEGFESYTSPNFSNYFNITTDSSGCDWNRIADGLLKSGNGTTINGPEGSYFAKSSAWEWDYNNYGDIVTLNPINFTTQGSYLLSFNMMHERSYNGSDRIAVYTSTDGTSYSLVSDGSFNAIYRYNWSLSDDNPVWSTHYVDLSSLKGNGAVYIKLRGYSGGEHGSNVLIDDLKVTRY